MKIIFGMYTVSRKSRKSVNIYLEHVHVQILDRFDGYRCLYCYLVKELTRFYDQL